MAYAFSTTPNIYQGQNALTPTPFDTVVISYMYPASINAGSPNFFDPGFVLLDWGSPAPGDGVWAWLRDWKNARGGRRVVASLGGDGAGPVTATRLRDMYAAWFANPQAFVNMISIWTTAFAAAYGFTLDGIDFDYEYFAPADTQVQVNAKTTGLAAITVALKAAVPVLALSHSPPVPYVTSNTGGDATQTTAVYVSVLNAAAAQISHVIPRVFNQPAFTGGVNGTAVPTQSNYPTNGLPPLVAGSTLQKLADGTYLALAEPFPSYGLVFTVPLTATSATSGYVAPASLTHVYPTSLWGADMRVGLWQLGASAADAAQVAARWAEATAFANAVAQYALAVRESKPCYVSEEQWATMSLGQGVLCPEPVLIDTCTTVPNLLEVGRPVPEVVSSCGLRRPNPPYTYVPSYSTVAVAEEASGLLCSTGTTTLLDPLQVLRNQVNKQRIRAASNVPYMPKRTQREKELSNRRALAATPQCCPKYCPPTGCNQLAPPANVRLSSLGSLTTNNSLVVCGYGQNGFAITR